VSADLLWAVTDGPDGFDAVTLPEDRLLARRLKAQHDGAFWCTKQADGCGGRLDVIAGDINRVHFRHRTTQPCGFIGAETRAGAAYEHLRYQQLLHAWLVSLGYTPVLKRHLGADGRSDLHVIVDDVGLSLEVQLSALSVVDWNRRDAKYRRHAEHVVWLYGPHAIGAARTELSVRGVVLQLRPGPEVGVRDVDDRDDGVTWSTLQECRVDADGLHAPGLEQARAGYEVWQAEQGEKRRLEAEQAAAEASRQRRLEELRQGQLAALRAARAAQVMSDPRPEPRLRSGAPAAAGLEQWVARHPEFAYWQPPGFGWNWLTALPEEIHHEARALAYTTQVLVFSSPTQTLLAELSDDTIRQRVLDALESLGLIRRYLKGDVERWERS